MRKQLELDGVPPKRRPLIPEATQQGVVEKAEVPGAIDEVGPSIHLVELTDWFPDSKEPPCSGYWEVRETFDVHGKIIRHFYDSTKGQWPAFLDHVAKFEWRGLKAPAPGGYPYDLHQRPARRRIVLPD